MKRAFRRAALLLMVCLLCIGLCGCNVDVDELRTQHGVWDADGNIVLNGAIYKRLPNTVDPEVDWAYTNTVFVSEADVPLLIARIIGDNCYFDTTGTLINRYGAVYCRSDRYDDIASQYQLQYGYYDEDGNIIVEGTRYVKLDGIKRSKAFAPCYGARIKVRILESEDASPTQTRSDEVYMSADGVLLENFYGSNIRTGFYCREDRCDELLRRINEDVEYTRYGYTFGDTVYDLGDGALVYVLSAEDTAMIDSVMAEVTPVAGDVSLYKETSLYLQRCTEDLYFVENAAIAVVVRDDAYTLVDYSGDDMLSYAVPTEYTEDFHALTEYWLASGKHSVEHVGEYY